MTERQKASELREPLSDDKWRVEWWNEVMRLMLPSDRRVDKINIYSNGTIQITLKLEPTILGEVSK